MKTEQEQIEEMAKQMCGDKDTFAKDLCSCCIAWDDCLEEAGNLYKAGYRKASEVIDEFAKRIKERALHSCREIINCYEVKRIETVIDDIAAEMKQEVEK